MYTYIYIYKYLYIPSPIDFFVKLLLSRHDLEVFSYSEYAEMFPTFCNTFKTR